MFTFFFNFTKKDKESSIMLESSIISGSLWNQRQMLSKWCAYLQSSSWTLNWHIGSFLAGCLNLSSNHNKQKVPETVIYPTRGFIPRFHPLFINTWISAIIMQENLETISNLYDGKKMFLFINRGWNSHRYSCLS